MKLALFASLALLFTTCGGGPYSMRTVMPAAPLGPASADSAQIVFACDTDDHVVSFVDEDGRFLGQVRERSWMAVNVEPGDHRFIALVDASAVRIDAHVEAGRTYFVLAERLFARGFQLRAIKRGSERWILRSRYLGHEHVEIDPEHDAQILRTQLGDVPQRILEGDREWERLTDTERRARTLDITDGVIGDPMGESGGPGEVVVPIGEAPRTETSGGAATE